MDNIKNENEITIEKFFEEEKLYRDSNKGNPHSTDINDFLKDYLTKLYCSLECNDLNPLYDFGNFQTGDDIVYEIAKSKDAQKVITNLFKFAMEKARAKNSKYGNAVLSDLKIAYVTYKSAIFHNNNLFEKGKSTKAYNNYEERENYYC